MDRRALDSTRAGREALSKLDKWINSILALAGEQWNWRFRKLRDDILNHCRKAMEYNAEWDINEQAKQCYMQGLASRSDIKQAIATVLDGIDLYDQTILVRLNKVYKEILPEAAQSHGDAYTILSGLLLALSNIIDDNDIPPPVNPNQLNLPFDTSNFHYRLGPLQFPLPFTFTKRKPDTVYTGLAFAIEAELRLATKGEEEYLTPGTTMPVVSFVPGRPDDFYEITAAFLRATIDPSATPRKTEARMEKLLRDYPGIQWIGWPIRALTRIPLTTSQISTRRKAR